MVLSHLGRSAKHKELSKPALANTYKLQHATTASLDWHTFAGKETVVECTICIVKRLLKFSVSKNNLMELWSLLHFLMPYIFRSRKEFSYWFSNPMQNLIEGKSDDHSDDVVMRLHGIIRPFVLRRLKKDVETQMPGKFEHIVHCRLSRRQVRYQAANACYFSIIVSSLS